MHMIAAAVKIKSSLAVGVIAKAVGWSHDQLVGKGEIPTL
jgi:hypothetical protein